MISFSALPNDPLGLEPGVRYLFDDSIAADFLKNDLAKDWRREEFDRFGAVFDHLREVTASDARSMRILIIRCGGIGDLLFLTPALAALLERYPEVEFTLCAFERYRPIIAHPKLDRLQWLDYPPKMDDVNAFDAVVPLEGVVETQHDRPAIALFAEAMGITDLPATTKPLFRVPSEGLLAAQQEFPKAPSVKFYGIGLRAGHDARTWPFEYCEQAAKLLLDRDPTCIVFLFGERDKFPGIEGLEHPRVVWLPAADLNLKEPWPC
jgi:ADP-heptose:LPS heptosyltransferase